MLSAGELRVLSSLEEPRSVTAIADAIDRSPSYVSRLVTSLEDKGLLTHHRDGREKVVTPQHHEAVTRYQDLVRRHPHVAFPDLLQGTAIPVVYYLDEPRTVSEIADNTNNYRNTIHRIVTRLQERGIVTKRDGTYVLTDTFADLARFADALVTHRHRHAAPVPATVLWATVDECLLQTDTAIDDEAYHLTGPHRFAEYDIPLVTTDQRYYFHSERLDELAPSDVVCHTLVIDDGARYQGYCLLLIEQEGLDHADLTDRASHYDIEATVTELLDYLESEGDTTTARLPSWRDFEQLAAEYEVTI